MATLFPFPSSKAQVRAKSSANWAEVSGGKGLASVVSKLETTASPDLLFPSKAKPLPPLFLRTILSSKANIALGNLNFHFLL